MSSPRTLRRRARRERAVGVPTAGGTYAESFKDEAHLDAIVKEAQEMVNTALASSG
jgi:phosphoglucomutase